MRLFVAVDLPATAKDELGGAIERLRPSMPDAKWVPRDNIHLTLSFLGEVAEGRVEAILEALTGAVSPLRRFEAALAGSGAFPTRRRARVLWVGLESDQDQLPALASAVAEGLEPLGFPREARAWTAHLTLARLRTPGDVSGLLPIPIGAVRFDVADVTVFRSKLARPAPRYEPVARVPIGG